MFYKFLLFFLIYSSCVLGARAADIQVVVISGLSASRAEICSDQLERTRKLKKKILVNLSSRPLNRVFLYLYQKDQKTPQKDLLALSSTSSFFRSKLLHKSSLECFRLRHSKIAVKAIESSLLNKKLACSLASLLPFLFIDLLRSSLWGCYYILNIPREFLAEILPFYFCCAREGSEEACRECFCYGVCNGDCVDEACCLSSRDIRCEDLFHFFTQEYNIIQWIVIEKDKNKRQLEHLKKGSLREELHFTFKLQILEDMSKY